MEGIDALLMWGWICDAPSLEQLVLLRKDGRRTSMKQMLVAIATGKEGLV
jgi:hypothetical protein